MARSTLTCRTLGLASVALVLACVHAVYGRQPTTYRNQSGVKGSRVAASSGAGRSGVATFTTRAAGSRAGIATFNGERQPVRISKPAAPAGARAAAAGQATRIARARDPVVIRTAYAIPDEQPAPEPLPGQGAVRRPREVAREPDVPESALKDPVLRAALQRPAQRAAPAVRNVFALSGGLPPAQVVYSEAVRAASSPEAHPPADGSSQGTPSTRRSSP